MEPNPELEQLILRIKSSDTTDRTNAIMELRQRADATWVDALAGAVRTDHDSMVRQGAFDTMAAIGVPAVDALLALLGEQDPDLRFRATSRPGTIGDPRGVEPIAGLVADASQPDYIRDAGAVALGKLGDERAVPALEAAAASDQQRVRNAGVEGLHRLRGE